MEGPCKVKVAQSCPTLCDPTEFSVHGILQARYWSGQPFLSPGDLPNPGIEPRSPTFLGDSLPAKPQGKPKNTGVGSPSPLLQGIIPTQESNRGLLHYRRILYQLSYQGSPRNPDGTSLNSTSPSRNSSRFSLTGLWTHLLTQPAQELRSGSGVAPPSFLILPYWRVLSH